MIYGFIPDLSKDDRYGYTKDTLRYPAWYRYFFATKFSRFLNLFVFFSLIAVFVINPHTYNLLEIALLWVVAFVASAGLTYVFCHVLYFTASLLTSEVLIYFLAFGAGARILRKPFFVWILVFIMIIQFCCRVLLFFKEHLSIVTDIICFLIIYLMVMNSLYYDYGLGSFTHNAFEKFANGSAWLQPAIQWTVNLWHSTIHDIIEFF